MVLTIGVILKVIICAYILAVIWCVFGLVKCNITYKKSCDDHRRHQRISLILYQTQPRA